MTATSWVVDDGAAARLMELTHGAVERGEAPGVALSRAQVEIIEAARRVSSPHFHPFFWAPFVQF